ncbi:MAG: carboxylesterase family protein [Bacilli bacterium]|nr:carboxylesterase family protein [Bacilli bacterium]
MTKEQLRLIGISKQEMQLLYGENKVLEENIDPEHSVSCHNGTFIPKINGDVSCFMGIPFALPPVGERRWKKPEPLPNSDKIYEAYYNGKSPIQTLSHSERASCYPQSEDCLYLNIWNNHADKTPNKPIMVFIHGGSYGWGGTVDPLYDGFNFVSLHPDIILITIAYRTGIMGFIDLSYLKGGEDFRDSPNLGIYDQIEALRWVKNNGKAFGGDIDNVTIFGESAGGGSVSILPIVKEAKGLFRRVIAESGSLSLTYSKSECKVLTDKLIESAKTDSMEDLMKFTEGDIKELNESLNDFNNFPMRDGKLIPFDPYLPYKEGYTKDIDMLFGTNANEMNYWIGELGGLFQYSLGMPIKYKADLNFVDEKDRPNVKEFMRHCHGNKVARISEFYNEIMFRLPAIVQADGHSNNGGNMYMYYWKEESKIPLYKACHAVELAYVFYNIEDTIYTGKPADEALARSVSDMWAAFAKTGNPSIEGLSWERYDEANRKTMVIKKDDVHMEEDVLSKQREYLTPIVPYMINPGYANLNLDMSLFSKTTSVISASLYAISTLLAENILKD